MEFLLMRCPEERTPEEVIKKHIFGWKYLGKKRKKKKGWSVASWKWQKSRGSSRCQWNCKFSRRILTGRWLVKRRVTIKLVEPQMFLPFPLSSSFFRAGKNTWTFSQTAFFFFHFQLSPTLSSMEMFNPEY